MRYHDDDDPDYREHRRRPREFHEEDDERPIRRKTRSDDDLKYRAPLSKGEPAMTVIIIGLVIFLVGLFFMYVLGVINDPDWDLIRWFRFVAQIAWIVGTLMISGTLVLIGLRKDGISPAVRVALIIASVAMLVYMLDSIPELVTNINYNLPYFDW